jgi:hypothetical protein
MTLEEEAAHLTTSNAGFDGEWQGSAQPAHSFDTTAVLMLCGTLAACACLS